MGETLSKIKEFWKNLAVKTKRFICIAAAVLLVAAVALTVVLNRGDGYIVLFPDMTTSESAEVYQVLQARGVETKINSSGEIEVLESQWDSLVFELAALGYPQSTPGYSTFFDNLSMTMTEFERRETLRFELQDRIQTTLKRVRGIDGAIVTIYLPEGSSYVWKDDESKATASVTLTLNDPKSFTKKNVSAVKNLVAYAAQQMDPSDVKVIDATSGVELFGEDDLDSQEYEIDSRENYERIICEKYEENVLKILESVYGDGKVVVACTVTIDYDKVVQEVKEYLSNEDGYGVPSHIDTTFEGGDYDSDPNGVIGEENNTDIPGYVNGEDTVDTTNTELYRREVEYSVGYIFTQTEKASGLLSNATISVVIKSANAISDTERQNVIALVRNATNIQNSDNISVMSWLDVDESIPVVTEPEDELINWRLIFIIGGIGLGVIFIVLLVAAILHRRMNKKIRLADQANQEALLKLEEQLDESERKSLIEQAADANKAQKMAAGEVRKFAKENPELTASIIRSMLKEDEENGTGGE